MFVAPPRENICSINFIYAALMNPRLDSLHIHTGEETSCRRHILIFNFSLHVENNHLIKKKHKGHYEIGRYL